MSLRCVRIDFANAISSKTVFITQEVFDDLIRKYEARERRHSFVYKLSHENREERRCHLDLDGVVLIEPCGGAAAS